MGVIIGGKLVKNGRTDERTTANERSVCCALPKNYSFDRIYIYIFITKRCLLESEKTVYWWIQSR